MGVARVLSRLRERQEWKFFSVLPRADRPLAVTWWAVLILRGALPAVFAIAVYARSTGRWCSSQGSGGES